MNRLQVIQLLFLKSGVGAALIAAKLGGGCRLVQHFQHLLREDHLAL